MFLVNILEDDLSFFVIFKLTVFSFFFSLSLTHILSSLFPSAVYCNITTRDPPFNNLTVYLQSFSKCE